jgi:membrane protein
MLHFPLNILYDDVLSSTLHSPRYTGWCWPDRDGTIRLEWSMTIELIIRLLMTTVRKWWDDNPWRLSAALSYYTLFSIAPLLTLAVAVAAVVVDESVVQGELFRQLEELIGEKGTSAMTPMLYSAGHPVHGTLATLISVITLFIVSMGMFSELQDALNLIWRIPKRPRSSALLGVLRTRLFSFLLVIGTGFLLVAALILNVVMVAAGKFTTERCLSLSSL